MYTVEWLHLHIGNRMKGKFYIPLAPLSLPFILMRKDPNLIPNI